MLVAFISIVGLLFLGLFLWFWWRGPSEAVPLHIDEFGLRRLEVQDRLRQTSYQVLTAVGLAVTFFVTFAQFMDARSHWSAEYTAKLAHDRLEAFNGATKSIVESVSEKKDEATVINEEKITVLTDIGILGVLAVENAEVYNSRVTDLLKGYIGKMTKFKGPPMPSLECTNEDWTGKFPEDKYPAIVKRPQALPGVQASVRALGAQNFAHYRLHAERGACRTKLNSRRLLLENTKLDDLDLSGIDLSCSQLTQVQFHRTSLAGANLSFADLSGSRFADWDIKVSPANRSDGGPEISGKTFNSSDGPPAWQKYYCWRSDLRYADFSNANLQNTTFAGADLQGANFADADMWQTDFSRANLQDATGLTEVVLQGACAGNRPKSGEYNEDAQPVGLAGVVLKPCAQFDIENKFSKSADKGSITRWISSLTPSNDTLKFTKVHVAPFILLGFVSLIFHAMGNLVKNGLEVSPNSTHEGFLSRFPEKTLSYSARDLEIFKASFPDKAEFYRRPTLFPIDALVMTALAAALAYCSWLWLRAAHFEYPFLGLLLPATYWLSDVSEDFVLFRYLSPSVSLNEVQVARLKKLTFLKFLSIWAAIAQTLGCFAYLLYWEA